MLTALIQGETTGRLSEEAAEAARQVQEETGSGLEGVTGLFEAFLDYLKSPEFISNILLTVIVVILGVALYRTLTHGVPRILQWRRRRGRDLLDAEAVARIKRQDTAITLFRNALRYTIFLIVLLFVLSIFIRNPLPATAGATILVAIIGFGAQSFLRDIIAGFSIVFEGQYNVGDFIYIEPQKLSGVVEELGLRVTKIRSPSGEVIFVPNGNIWGVVNYVSGNQRFTLEVQLNDAEAASRVVHALDEVPADLYLNPPRIMGREESNGRVRLRILAGVLPSMNWLVEESLTGRIKAAAGEESLVGEPLIYKVDRANLRRVRSLIPHQDE